MEDPKDLSLLDEDEDSNQTKTGSTLSLNSQSKAFKYNISPNRPNSTKIELKSIDRPRSHSPMKLNGIEDYIQQYEKRKSIENLSYIPNKITMNLKMDDLLVNKNESTSYQMLSDFSVLTGDIDEFTSKTRSRKSDEDDDDEPDDEENNKDDKKKLNYKYTAVYKKDETTGAFQEKSRTVFENKKTEIIPVKPNILLALETLKSNSEKLDKKIEKIEDITPSSNDYFDSSISPETPVNEIPVIKKKNDAFFNDILTKSDDLIAQTQHRLERLSKLETVNKPLAPLANPSPPPPKPKPTASLPTPQTTINNSKSLIDLKTSQSQINIPEVSNITTDSGINNEVDLLFDQDNQFIPVVESIKPVGSYFDLIGLESDPQPLPPTTLSLNSDLLELGFGPPIIPNIDIQITEPMNEINDNNIVPEGYFNLKHEIPNDQSRPHSPSLSQPQSPKTETPRPLSPQSPVTAIQKSLSQDTAINLSSSPMIQGFKPSSPISDIPIPPLPINRISEHSEPNKEINLLQNSINQVPKVSSPTIDMPRPLSPINQESKLPSLTNETYRTKPSIQEPKKTVWTKGDSQGESSSSSDEDEKKFQVRIRPKAANVLSGQTHVPLLPKPPKSAEEIEEFRQRRLSSDAASITYSIKDDSSSEEELPKPAITDRKESVQSEFILELPDDDDSLPLSDFNEKFELSKYTDGSYGCIVLVRQPFRNPNVMYKNAIQKVTDVRTWTECLVKLVDSESGGKKLIFFNAHELMTLAAEKDQPIETIIENNLSNSTAEQTGDKIRPFHEIELKTSFKFTEMSLQQYDNYTKIHTFKIQEVIFKETFHVRPDRLMALPERLLKKFTKPKATSLLDHTPLPFEICKFAHLSHSYLRSFLLLLQDAFWSLPTVTRKKQREDQLEQLKVQSTTSMSLSAAAASFFSLGSNKQIQTPTLNSVTMSHIREEITVKVVDEYRAILDCECRVKSHKSRTRVYLIAFLNSSDPIIEIGLNDVLRHGKEIVGRRDIIPIKTEQWISPELFELNEKVVDKEEFEKTHCLRCVQMPDNLLVEIMRFRTRPRRNYELPLQVRCYMNMVNRQVEIRIECTVAGSYFLNVTDVFCEDIQIRFPLPDVWVYLFRVEKMFRYGAVHSTKSKLGKIKGLDRLLVHKTTHQSAIMEASCGMAKYEQAFKSLVWRIDQLPAKNKDVYKTQLFVCRLNLQEYDQLPEKYEEIAQVQFSIPICASSKCQVRSVSVNTSDEPPEKWAKLKSRFEYDLDINYAFDQKELPKLDMEKCDELQHLQSQTESEGDNNDDDD